MTFPTPDVYPTRDDVFWFEQSWTRWLDRCPSSLVGRGYFVSLYIFSNTIGWIRCFYLSTSSNVNYPRSNLARHELEGLAASYLEICFFLSKSTDRNLSGGINFFGLLHTELDSEFSWGHASGLCDLFSSISRDARKQTQILELSTTKQNKKKNLAGHVELYVL